MRNYQTTPLMLADPSPFSQQAVIQPDRNLVKQLHQLLDTLPENTALAIDLTVAEIIKFRNPNRQRMSELLPPEVTE